MLRWFRRRRRPLTRADERALFMEKFSDAEIARLNALSVPAAAGALGTSAAVVTRRMWRLGRELNREAIDRAAVEAEFRVD